MPRDTHLPVDKFLDRGEPLLPIHAHPHLLAFFILLDGEHDGWDIEISKYRVDEANLLVRRPHHVLSAINILGAACG